MKVAELFEGPYHIGQDAPFVKAKSYPSLEGLQRENTLLGTLEKDGNEFHFWLSKTKGSAKVTVASKDDIGQDRQLVVVNLVFQGKVGLPVKNELQVNTVYTDPDFRTSWLAGALYIVLARYDFAIVSDFQQYNGGKALWKKLAKESDARNYAVRVWDDNQEDWIKDEDGNPLKYTAANLADDQIWLDISKHDEATTLLCLQHR